MLEFCVLCAHFMHISSLKYQKQEGDDNYEKTDI